MNAQTSTATLSEPVVVPESIEQCHALLGNDGVLELHGIARDAGFESVVIATGDTLRRIVGERAFGRGGAEVMHALSDALHELRNTMRQCPAKQALAFTHHNQDGIAIKTLVQSNYMAIPPFTLWTLQ